MVAALVPAGTAHAGGPGVWTKIAKVDNGFDYPGMFRTSDGRLHVVWRKKLLDNEGQAMNAPSSFNTNVDNEPRQPVALAARNGGGVFLAYCAPTSTKACAHLDLWKVGTSTPKIVPGTSSGTITRVALADGLQGRISVVTGDLGRGKINAVRTNTMVSAFGVVRTINMPPDWLNFNTLEAEGTFGCLDIVANVLVATSPNPIFLSTRRSWRGSRSRRARPRSATRPRTR